MKYGEIEVLRDVAIGGGRGPLPKSFFDTFPYKRRIAKDLMWRGLLEGCGTSLDNVRLTPAGRAALDGGKS